MDRRDRLISDGINNGLSRHASEKVADAALNIDGKVGVVGEYRGGWPAWVSAEAVFDELCAIALRNSSGLMPHSKSRPAAGPCSVSMSRR